MAFRHFCSETATKLSAGSVTPDTVTKGLAGTCLFASGVAGKMAYDHFYGLASAVDLLKEKFATLDMLVALELKDLKHDVKTLKDNDKQLQADVKQILEIVKKK